MTETAETLAAMERELEERTNEATIGVLQGVLALFGVETESEDVDELNRALGQIARTTSLVFVALGAREAFRGTAGSPSAEEWAEAIRDLARTSHDARYFEQGIWHRYLAAVAFVRELRGEPMSLPVELANVVEMMRASAAHELERGKF